MWSHYLHWHCWRCSLPSELRVGGHRMTQEAAYARILARVHHDELGVKCREVVTRDTKLIARRIRGAQRALEHAYDVHAAVQRLPQTRLKNAKAIAAIAAEIEALQQRIATTISHLTQCSSNRTIVKGTDSRDEEDDTVLPKTEPERDPGTIAVTMHQPSPQTPQTSKGKKRKLGRDLTGSPSKPPLAERCHIATTPSLTIEIATRAGPHHPHAPAPASSDEDSPIDLDVPLSDPEEATEPVYLVTARDLRDQPPRLALRRLPALIKQLQSETAAARPTSSHEAAAQVEAIRVAMDVAMGLSAIDCEKIHLALDDLLTVAKNVKPDLAKRFPAFTSSRSMFATFIESYDAPTGGDETMEALFAATAALRARAAHEDEPKSLEAIEDVFQAAANVFDNPHAIHSAGSGPAMAQCVDFLIEYVDQIPRSTRRKRQCEDMLGKWRELLTI